MDENGGIGNQEIFHKSKFWRVGWSWCYITPLPLCLVFIRHCWYVTDRFGSDHTDRGELVKIAAARAEELFPGGFDLRVHVGDTVCQFSNFWLLSPFWLNHTTLSYISRESNRIFSLVLLFMIIWFYFFIWLKGNPQWTTK